MNRAQLPYLRAMARSSRAIGDFESAQRTLRYAFRIHDMGRGALDATALADSLAYFRLARDIYIDPRSPNDVGLFFEAYLDNEAMLESLQAAAADGGQVPYKTLRAVAISQLRMLYLLMGTELHSERLSAAEGAAWDFLQRSQMLSLSKGRKIIEGLLAHPDAESGSEQARLYLRLGNWQQWNNKWQGACDSYAQAWQAAQSAADNTMLERLGRPSELPEDARLWESLHDPEIPVKATIKASFDVSRRGYVSRVDAAVTGDENSALAGRVGRWLRDSHVRPAVSDEGCIDGHLDDRVYRLLR